MCNRTENENCETDPDIELYIKDLQVDTWIVNEVIDFTNFDSRPTFPIQKLLFSQVLGETLSTGYMKKNVL